MRYLAILVALIAIPIMAQTTIIQPPSSAPATETRTFTLQSGGKLKVSGVNADIKITAWDKNEVALTADFKPDSNDKHAHIKAFESNGNALELIVKRPKGKNVRRPASCEIELKVPNHLIVGNIKTVNGNVLLNAVRCDSRTNTVNGNIVLENVIGRINAYTVNGNINMELIVSNHIVGNIKTVNGNVLLNAITGDSGTNTVNDSVALRDVNSRINAGTVNGNIVGSIQNVKKLNTSTVNGSIDIKLLNPSGSLSASAESGSIKLLTLGIRDIVEIKGSKKNSEKKIINAKFTDDDADLKFSTVSGSITIR